MSDADLSAASAPSALRPALSTLDDAVVRLPPQPKSVRETGLGMTLLIELAAKAIQAVGRVHLPELAGRLRLSINVLREVLGAMQAEQLAEVALRGDSDLDVYYQLTSIGRARAIEYMARCRYVGPVPVTLQAYHDVVLRQSRRHARLGRISAADMAAAFADDVIEPVTRALIGAALQSGRSLLLYGPSGSGKTTLARKLGQLQQGVVAVPYAILIDQVIVQVHDPLVHLAPPPMPARHGEERRTTDARWTLCQRPVVQVGADFSADMLELRFDEAGGVYHAPPHLMANNGMLVIDDLGRQRMQTADLLNRWSSPLDSGTDHLSMQGGHKMAMPFDVSLLFATNIAPHLLLDESSMRRIGYKVHVGPLSDANYRSLLRRQCRAAGIACDEAAIEHLIIHLHGGSAQPLLACYPADLLSRISDFASFAGMPARLTVDAVEQAWISMFAGTHCGAPAPAHAPVSYFAVSGDPLLEKIS